MALTEEQAKQIKGLSRTEVLVFKRLQIADAVVLVGQKHRHRQKGKQRPGNTTAQRIPGRN
jgi:hypothetical protein